MTYLVRNLFFVLEKVFKIKWRQISSWIIANLICTAQFFSLDLNVCHTTPKNNGSLGRPFNRPGIWCSAFLTKRNQHIGNISPQRLFLFREFIASVLTLNGNCVSDFFFTSNNHNERHGHLHYRTFKGFENIFRVYAVFIIACQLCNWFYHLPTCHIDNFGFFEIRRPTLGQLVQRIFRDFIHD